MIFEYETFKLIWWAFIGVLLIGFALSDGFDLGVGALLPFLGKTDSERRVIINTVGPTWEGNQVWFITAGGALFAAWPLVYAAAFSGLYIALILVLFTLIFRPVGFDYRSKVADPRWRAVWDWGLFAGGAVPALIFGVAFGNLLQGLPFHLDADMRPVYTGSFFALLNPFALLAGVVSLSMLIMHGAIYLQLRTEGVIYERAKKTVRWSGALMIIGFVIAGVWAATAIDGYRIVAMPDPNTASNVLAKTVEVSPGGWMRNYSLYPWMATAPILAIIGAAGAILLTAKDKIISAFMSSSLSVASVILTAGFSMFPFIMPSATEPNSSLTIWDAASSYLTLSLMFWAVVIFLPVILLYTSWVYRVLRGKITSKQIEENTHSVY